MLQPHQYRKRNKTGRIFQAFRFGLIFLIILFVSAQISAQKGIDVIKVTSAKEIYLRSLKDTAIVYGPILSHKDGGDGYLAVEVLSGKWNLLDAKLLPVFQKPVDDVTKVHKGVFLANQKGKWGLADVNAKWIVKPEFDKVFPFSEGVAFVMKKDLWGAINTKGDYVINPTIKHLKGMNELQMKDNRCIVYGEGGFYVMDEKGKYLNTKPFKKIKQIFHLRFFAIENASYELFDKQLNKIPTSGFEWVDDEWQSHPVKVKERMKFGFFDLKKDSLILPCEYESLGHFKDGFALVKDDKGFSFCDSVGDVFSSHWPYLKNLGRGLFAFSLQQSSERTYGLMDYLGKVIIPTGFSDLEEFRGDWAPALKNGRYYMIDIYGAPLFEEFFDRIIDYNEKYAIVAQGDKSWIIDKKGKVIVRPGKSKFQLL
jgi:hypothetical protein